MKLQRYVFATLLRSFLPILVAVTSVVFLAGLVSSLGRYHQLPLGQILERLPYLVPFAVALSIPLSFLIACLLTYGRLSADNEILAIRMGGVHPLRAIMPALTLGALLAGLTLWLNGTIAPESSRRAREIRTDDVRILFESLASSGRRSFESEHMRLEWQEVDEDGWILDPRFEIAPREGDRVYGGARRGSIRRDEDLENIYITFLDLEAFVGEGASEVRSRRWDQVFKISDLFDTTQDRDRKEVLKSAELRFRFLRDPALTVRSGGVKMIRFRVEYLKRIALAFSCILFVLIGAPLGMIFRRGSFIGATILSLLIVFLIYYPLLEAGKSLANEKTLSPALATALPSLVIGLIGLGLTTKVART